jgi:hypothetical protein
MAGYRPDDDWALTTESGEPTSGGWKITVAFLGVLIAAILIGKLGHVPLWAFVGIAVFIGVPALCIWKIILGLRTGIVAVRHGSYSRAEHPFRYWMLMVLLAALTAWLLGLVTVVVFHGH